MAHEAHEIKLPHICSVPLRTGGKEGTHSRTFTKVRHSFWPRLIATYALGWVGEPMHTFIFFFLKARRAVMGPAKRGPIWAG